MFKSLRVPEVAFRVVMWAVSLALAWFLIGLGGKVIADLPRLGSPIAVEEFADRPALDTARKELAALEERERQLADAREREAQAAMERIDRDLVETAQRAAAVRETEADLLRAADRGYQRARFLQELRVFAVRLAVTLPLLVLAWWFAARRRHSDYWLLMRGFIIFALFMFFVELVPYLPSYSGYVRYGVGIVLTAVLGHYVIQALRRYLARRAEVEQQTEGERRRLLASEDALKKMSAKCGTAGDAVTA